MAGLHNLKPEVAMFMSMSVLIGGQLRVQP